MADTIISSQNLTVVYVTDDTTTADLIKFVLPDCKSDLTESQIKNTQFNFMSAAFGIKTKTGKTLTKSNMLTADITATEKINISLE